jgi:hypothetical protein
MGLLSIVVRWVNYPAHRREMTVRFLIGEQVGPMLADVDPDLRDRVLKVIYTPLPDTQAAVGHLHAPYGTQGEK